MHGDGPNAHTQARTYQPIRNQTRTAFRKMNNRQGAHNYKVQSIVSD